MPDVRLDTKLSEMNRILQGLLFCIFFSFLSPLLLAQKNEGGIAGKYKEPTINRRLFSEGLNMLDSERDEYATNITAYAVMCIRDKKRNQATFDLARKLIGLALHLSPRNKKSLIVNRQLAKGIIPNPVVSDYTPDVFSKILLARGQLLEKQKGPTNALVARYFIELASLIDPRNEDAIYESEIRRIDHGDLSWKKITDAKK